MNSTSLKTYTQSSQFAPVGGTVRNTKTRYVVTLETPDTDALAVRRLRAALKTLLRSFRLKAVYIKQVETKT